MVSKPETVAEALERIKRFHQSVVPADLSGEQRIDLQVLMETLKSHRQLRSTTSLAEAVRTSGLDNAVATYYNKWIARWDS